FEETPEEAKYYEGISFPKSDTTSSAAPSLPSNVHYSDRLKRQDQELVALTNMGLKLFRPIDATAHAIVSTSDPDSDINSNILYSLDYLRHQIALMLTKITHMRESAVFREKGLKTTESNTKTVLFETSQLVEQYKFTQAVNRADYAKSRPYNRGHSKGRGQYQFNAKNAQSSATPNTTQTNNTTPSTQSQDSNSQQHFRPAPPHRGRGRGKTTTFNQ
ncbi:hypothetical protein BGZ76_007497, partial [Entomortierella beljakovae]